MKFSAIINIDELERDISGYTVPDAFLRSVRLLQKEGDFLTFTLKYPKKLASPFFFKVPAKLLSGSKQSEIKVTVIETGIILFEPAPCSSINEVSNIASMNLAISCGIHGNETAPIELCNDLIKELIVGKIKLTQRLLFIIGNPLAIIKGVRFDEENLNNLFSKNKVTVNEGTAEQERAWVIEQAISQFFSVLNKKQPENTIRVGNFHLDLHTAIRGSCYEKFAISPYLHGQAYSKVLLNWLANFSVPALLLANKPTNAFAYFSSSQCNANAITIELGKAKPFGENNPDDLHDIRNSLISLCQGRELSISGYHPKALVIFETAQVINKNKSDFSLYFDEQVKNFTEFPPGHLLATEGNTRYVVGKQAEAIVFPNANVAKHQRALLTVVKTNEIRVL